jgi:hypothetical protein
MQDAGLAAICRGETLRMGREQCYSGNQGGGEGAHKYGEEKRQRFTQLSAHRLFPRPRLALQLIR